MLTKHHSKRSALLLCLAVLLSGLLMALLLLGTGAGTVRAQLDVIYVDEDATDPTPDGTSWTSAFTTVQDALAAAGTGDEIWVAEGVYYPDEGTGRTNDDPTSTFSMEPGVELYGGFVGTETVRTQRDWTAHVTVLSGDVGKDDQVTEAGVVTGTAYISGTNAYHVVTGSGVTETARLDGFTVTAGDGTGDTAAPEGGGMRNVGSDPTVVNLRFSGNEADAGGAMYNADSSPSLTGLIFSGNEAETGGGMYNEVSSNPRLVHVTFSFNLAATGGGMYNHGSSPELRHTAFVANEALGGSGGGIYNDESDPTLVDVDFITNFAVSAGFDDPLGFGGGGMYNHHSSPVLTRVEFKGNGAYALDSLGGVGGGMYNESSSNPTLTEVTFTDNTAPGGGGMFNTGSSPTLRNCSFSGNEASGGSDASGGGMLNMGASAPRLTQVTFSRNRADFGGGGMANGEASSPTLNHVTFRGNEAVTLGGGMYNLDSSPLITNTMFRGNRAGAELVGGGGGGLSSGGGSPRLTNVVFSGNWSTNSGGGMVLEGGNPVLTNVTLAGNRVEPGQGSEDYPDEAFVGGGLGLCDTRAMLIDCVLAGNAAPSGPQIGYLLVPTETVSTATIRYSAVQGSGGSGSGWDPEVGIDGGGNIDADPRFVAPVAASAAPTTTGDYRLQIGSPAVDAGTNGAVAVTMDLDGNPRVVDGDGDGSPTVDMGAYERQRPVGGATVAPAYWPLAVDRKLVVASMIALGSLAALAVALLVRRGRR